MDHVGQGTANSAVETSQFAFIFTRLPDESNVAIAVRIGGRSVVGVVDFVFVSANAILGALGCTQLAEDRGEGREEEQIAERHRLLLHLC